MRVLVLIDGVHGKELIASLTSLVTLEKAEVLLAFVRAPGSRSGLGLMRPWPGAHLPAQREHEMTEAEVAAAADALADADEAARAAGASAETVQIAGNPGRAVCEMAAKRKVDLVVVRAGGRDRPPFGPASLGPTARYITDHCPVPVLLIRS